jgi:hypothetical protein
MVACVMFLGDMLAWNLQQAEQMITNTIAQA